MDTPTIPSPAHREYKFGRHWSPSFTGVSDEVSREKAREQHLNGDGYTVLILEAGQLVYVVTVNTNTKSRGVVFLKEPGENKFSEVFVEHKPGRLFLAQVSQYRKEQDAQTGNTIGVTKAYRFFPDGTMRIKKSISRNPEKREWETWNLTAKIDLSHLWLDTPPFGEFDPLLRRDFIDLDALEAQCPPGSWVRQGPPPKSPMPIDRAGYYLDDVRNLGLSDEHAENHTLFYLRWLIENGLVSPDYLKETAEVLTAWRAGKATMRDAYRFSDSVLMDDMLSQDGNAFTESYYAAEKKGYMGDCAAVLGGGLSSFYQIEYTEENYQRIKLVLDRRFQDWKRQSSQP